MALEIEISRLRAELEVTREAAREAIEQTHRQYRRDLVPVSTGYLPARRTTGR
jgi:hypothetical protein